MIYITSETSSLMVLGREDILKQNFIIFNKKFSFLLKDNDLSDIYL